MIPLRMILAAMVMATAGAVPTALESPAAQPAGPAAHAALARAGAATRPQAPVDLAAAMAAGDEARVLAALAPEDINRAGPTGATPLIQAAHAGSAKIVDALLARGAKVNVATEEGWTPLLAAVRTGDVETIERLVHAGAKVNAGDHEGQTPLMAAAAMGNPGAVRALLTAGARADAADAYGTTALHRAAWCGDVEATRLLLDAGASIHKPDGVGRTALLYAVGLGSRAEIALLLARGANPASQTAGGMTALALAGRSGDPGILEMLVPKPGDAHAALIEAISSENASLVKRVLEGGVDISGRAQWPDPVSLALKCTNPEILPLLLQHGANVNTARPNSTKPLATVAMGRPTAESPALMRRLLAAGADLKLPIGREPPFGEVTPGTPSVGTVAMQAAVGWKNPGLVKELLARGVEAPGDMMPAIRGGDEEIVALLLAHGAKVPETVAARLPAGAGTDGGRAGLALRVIRTVREMDAQAARQNEKDQAAEQARGNRTFRAQALQPALSAAAETGEETKVQALLAQGADPAMPDDAGWPPLIIAAGKGHRAALAAMLDHTPRPDIRSATLWTPLMMAAARGHADVVELLIARGASLQAQNGWHMSAMDYARRRGHTAVERLLRDAGAERDDPRGLVGAVMQPTTGPLAVLLNDTPNIDATDDQGWTALFYAIHVDRPEHVRLLLERGADAGHKDKLGRPALEFALLNGEGRRQTGGGPRPVADIDPLYVGVWRGTEGQPPHVVELVGLLLEHGADKGLKGEETKRVMDLAAAIQDEAMRRAVVGLMQGTPRGK